MCRRNVVVGFALTCFGLGLLIGLWLDGGFLCHFFGIGVTVAGGFFVIRK